MIRQVVTVKGKRYVLVPPTELRRLESLAQQAKDEPKLPPWPTANADGNFPALSSARVSIARSIIEERRALGMTQTQLAQLSGVRQETICRLESGRYSPTVRTVEKIDRALKRAASGQRGQRKAKKGG